MIPKIGEDPTMVDRQRLHSQPHPWRRYPICRLLLLAAAALASTVTGPTPLLAQKTDTLVVRNGDVMTGEIKEFGRGKVKFSTDAAGTIYVKWTRVLTAKTDKTFEITLEDGRTHFGSLSPGEQPQQVRLLIGRDTLVVATQRIVRMQRIKETFWKRLDGSVDLGLDFTQQNAKTDLSFSTEVQLKRRLDAFKFDLSTSFSRQDDADNISRLNTNLVYLREFAPRWFYAGLVAGEQNSQLSLDIRGSVGGLAGRFFVQSNKIILNSGLGVSYARERFTDQEGDNAVQVLFLTDFEFFSWGSLDTDLSSRLMVMPVINQAGRWRISFITSFKREIVSDFYFNVSINEVFDSKPPTQITAETNDLSLTTSFGWSF
ncbi:MAG: DUF481 domain-containing protein [Gemmatimonadota bacterium]|nr:MAG: DUF481 domain-containing protein [Gemmatimonadota bacterium]